jgi:hypothetical protein
VQETLGDVYQLVRSAGAKLAHRWPTLLALVLAGFTAKLATLKVALVAGRLAWPIGVFIFAFTAAGLLAAVVLMFRSIVWARDLPRFTTILAPFLVIYLATNHFDGYLVDPSAERPVTMDVAAASVLIVIVAARWLLPLWKSLQAKRWTPWVLLGLDICWMSLVAFTLASHPLSRWLAGFAQPVSWLLDALLAVVIVPLAWLAVGALAVGMRPADVPQAVRRAGLPLILATCLILLVAQKIPLLLWWMERFGAGPRDPQTFWGPISGLLGAANSAVGVLLVVCLVAALLGRSTDDEAGVPGQRGSGHEAYGDRFGIGGRGEEDGHLIRV